MHDANESLATLFSGALRGGQYAHLALTAFLERSNLKSILNYSEGPISIRNQINDEVDLKALDKKIGEALLLFKDEFENGRYFIAADSNGVNSTMTTINFLSSEDDNPSLKEKLNQRQPNTGAQAFKTRRGHTPIVTFILDLLAKISFNLVAGVKGREVKDKIHEQLNTISKNSMPRP